MLLGLPDPAESNAAKFASVLPRRFHISQYGREEVSRSA
jgi:hypothetical protein